MDKKKRKIHIDKPALIIIILVLTAAAAFSWQATKYTSGDRNTSGDEYVQKPYPVYNNEYDLIEVAAPTAVDLDSDGKSSRITLIGVQNFSQGANAEQNSCFANETKAKLNQYLTGKKIELEADAAAPSKDSTLPRYVIVNDENINKKMIEEGYATVPADAAKYRYYADFISAQENAKNNRLGLWSGAVCNIVASNSPAPSSGNRPSATPPTLPASSSPAAQAGDGRNNAPGSPGNSGNNCGVLRTVCNVINRL